MTPIFFALVPLLAAAGFAFVGMRLKERSPSTGDIAGVLGRYLAGVVGGFVILGTTGGVFRSFSSLPGEISARMSDRLDYLFLSSLVGAVVLALTLVDARLNTPRGRTVLGVAAGCLAVMNYLAWDTYLYLGSEGLGRSEFWSFASEQRAPSEITEVVSYSRRAGTSGPLRKIPHVVIQFDDHSWDTFFLLRDRGSDLLLGLKEWAPDAVFSDDDVHRVDFMGDDLPN